MTSRQRCAIVASLTMWAPATAAQPPAFSAKVEAVRVDALVTEHGQPVRGLGAGDFDILDNGVPQQVDLVSFEQVPVNVVLAVDMSNSVSGERLDRLRAAGEAALAALASGDQAALVTFSQIVTLGAKLSGDFATVRQAIESVKGAGQTSLVDGVFAGMMIGESDAGRALMIVFSDGRDTASFLTPDAVLEGAKRSDVVVYAVALKSKAKHDFLADLCSLTGGRLYELEGANDLPVTFRSIVEEFRGRYLVSYTPRGVGKDGWHRLDVRVKRPGVSVKARPGYLSGS